LKVVMLGIIILTCCPFPTTNSLIEVSPCYDHSKRQTETAFMT
jgi:hypothetical protein